MSLDVWRVAGRALGNSGPALQPRPPHEGSAAAGHWALRTGTAGGGAGQWRPAVGRGEHIGQRAVDSAGPQGEARGRQGVLLAAERQRGEQVAARAAPRPRPGHELPGSRMTARLPAVADADSCLDRAGSR